MTSHFPDHVKIAYYIGPLPPDEMYAVTDKNGSKMYLYDGFFIKLLSEALKFSISLMFTNEDMGKMTSDGNWTGLLGMLQREEADMSVDAIAITEEKIQVVDFSPPHVITDVTFMTHNPEPQPKNFAILNPFDHRIWIAIAAFFFTVSFFFYIMKRRTISYQCILLKMFGSLLAQDMQLEFRSWHKTYILLSWLVGVTVLNYSYKAVILSFLSFPPMIGIRDIADLSKAVADGSHVCITRTGSFVIDRLEKSKDPAIRIIGKSLKENSFTADDTIEILMKRENPRTVVINPRVNIRNFQNIYHISRDSFLMIMGGVAVRKTFCCKKKLNEVVRRIFEAGLYEKFLREIDLKEFLKKNFHPVVHENTHVLTLADLMSSFILLLAGHLLAATVFTVEYFFGKKFRKSVK